LDLVGTSCTESTVIDEFGAERWNHCGTFQRILLMLGATFLWLRRTFWEARSNIAGASVEMTGRSTKRISLYLSAFQTPALYEVPQRHYAFS
jgi:hypothetical protein